MHKTYTFDSSTTIGNWVSSSVVINVDSINESIVKVFGL